MATASMKIRLVIPCYNEALRFHADGFRMALEQRPGLRLLFVDDGSKDDTRGVIGGFCASHSERAQLLVLDRNGGKAEAVRQGMLHAVARPDDAEYLGYFDADLAIPLEEAFLFFAFLQDRRPAYILSARAKLLGTTRIDRYLYRHILGRIFATFVSTVMGVAVYDTQCGAKLVRSDMAGTLFREAFMDRWLFDVELLYRCMVYYGRSHLEEHVAEVPLRRLRDPGGSSVSLAHALRMPFGMLRIHRRYSRLLKGRN